ncbi:alpha-E domain-containing protein [Rhodovulum sp. DZ06]|uniref:alpha-E domain-containing protein n=1 Tax=Rhodovulum sp. DZ06 TaxID=3425126 RepID=UPI003D3259F5
MPMLSRTAEGLFWMSRYVERAENVARLLDAGRRMNTLPSPGGEATHEWTSVVIAAGCSDTYPRPLNQADEASVAHHLIFDRDNPSSIRSCFEMARSNARAMRTAITADMWDAANEAWSSMRARSPAVVAGGGLAPFLDWTKAQAQRFRGAADDTMLRDAGHHFVRLGQYIERADATARMLDVKYHVLLPRGAEVGGALDHVQWVQILRAANSQRAFRHVYRQRARPDLVADFLILNRASPRSMAHSYKMLVRHLDGMGEDDGRTRASLEEAAATLTRLKAMKIEEVFEIGLHEFLTEFIEGNHRLAVAIADDHGFGPNSARAARPAARVRAAGLRFRPPARFGPPSTPRAHLLGEAGLPETNPGWTDR